MVARPSSRRIKLLQDLSDDNGIVALLGEVVAFGFCLLSFAFCGSGALFVSGGVAGGTGGFPFLGGEGLRALVHSRALGMDLLCSPGSRFFRAAGFPFRSVGFGASLASRCGFAAGLLLLVSGGASFTVLHLLGLLFLVDLMQGCSGSHGSWRDWVVGQGRLTTDVLSPRISCGLPFGVAFLVWMRGEDDDDACWSAASRMKKRHNWEDQRKKKRVLVVISKFCRDPFAKRGSTVLDHVFMLM